MAMAPGEASISVLSRIPSRSRIPEPVLQPTNPILQGLPGTSEGQLLPGECPDRKEGNLFRLVPCSRFSPDNAGEVDDGHDRRSLVGIDVQQGKLLDLQRNLFSPLPHPPPRPLPSGGGGGGRRRTGRPAAPSPPPQPTAMSGAHRNRDRKRSLASASPPLRPAKTPG